MIDTHCHLEIDKYDGKREEVIEECGERLEAIIDSSAEIETAEKVLDLSENNDFVFSTLGLHPKPALSYTKGEIDEHMNLIRKNKEGIVGIGEMGLDYHLIKDKDKRKKTRDIFGRYVNLTKELSLPLVIHARDSINDVLDILEGEDLEDVVMHCFSGNIKQLDEALDRGYWISMSTLVLKSSQHKKLTSRIPMENILLETDSPYLSPDSDMNYPWKIEKAARKIAQIKGIDFEEVWRISKRNAVNAFNLSL